MNEDQGLAHGTNLPSMAARHADSPVGLTLRSAIASIPLVGGSISLLVEAHLSARQAQRIDFLYERVIELEACFDGLAGATAARPSEALLECATGAAASTIDQDRPHVFANILYLEGAGEDRSEILRRFLIEVCASLTRYEIALLMRHGPQREGGENSIFAERLLTLHSEHPEVEEVRQFSLERLATFRLITRSGSEVQLTAVGRHVLSVI